MVVKDVRRAHVCVQKTRQHRTLENLDGKGINIGKVCVALFTQPMKGFETPMKRPVSHWIRTWWKKIGSVPSHDPSQF